MHATCSNGNYQMASSAVCCYSYQHKLAHHASATVYQFAHLCVLSMRPVKAVHKLQHMASSMSTTVKARKFVVAKMCVDSCHLQQICTQVP